MHNLYFTPISGIKLGLELFFGDDLMEGDKFAANLDLLFLRITYVIEK